MPKRQHAISPTFGEARLGALQRDSIENVLRETNPSNGLVADQSQPWFARKYRGRCLALTAHPVGVVRGSLQP